MLKKLACYSLFLLCIAACMDTQQLQHYVTIQNSSGDHTFKVDLAVTTEERQLGLMHVQEMPADQGMLFVFPFETRQSFWMKNTYIPLDIIFISEAGEIVDIEHNARPLSERSIISRRPAKYVLEINGGLCRENGITAGNYVRLQNN